MTLNYFSYAGSTNSELLGQPCLYPPTASFDCLSNVQYVGIGQLGCIVFNTLRRIGSALSIAVDHVVKLCAKEQMVRVHTEGRITSMKNLNAVLDVPKFDEPREPVGSVGPAKMFGSAVSILFDFASPDPAAIGLFIDSIEESLFQRSSVSVVGHTLQYTMKRVQSCGAFIHK